MIVLNKFLIYIKRWKNTIERCIWKIYRLIKKITIVKKDLKARNVSNFNRHNCNESFYAWKFSLYAQWSLCLTYNEDSSLWTLCSNVA